jgi:anthranilate phosphoribosyltransferase
VVSTYILEPKDFGLEPVRLKELLGGTAEENALTVREILSGRKGPKRGVVCMNAAPALVAGKKAATLREGYALAEQIIDSGAAMEKLERLIAFTNK